MNQTAQGNDVLEKLGMALLFVFIGVLAVVWAGAQLACLLSQGHWLGASIEDAGHALFGMRQHLGDPRQAWPPEAAAELPGPILYWLATVVTLVAAGALAYLAHRVFRDPAEPLDPRTRAGVPAQGPRPTDGAAASVDPPPSTGTVRARAGRPPADRNRGADGEEAQAS